MAQRLFLNNGFILAIISLNALLIFTEGFFRQHDRISLFLQTLDHICTIVFIAEAYVKIRHFKARGYFQDPWNVFDFALVLVAVPSLLMLVTPMEVQSMDFLLTLRILRVFKFFRVLRFIPNIDALIAGVVRALRSSLLIVLAFFVLNFIFAILSFSFFEEVAPEYFANPILSFYSTFKIFTIEGWYEIPDLIAERSQSGAMAFFSRLYFVFLLFGGGIFGLSLINSIFVDSMMSDNNDEMMEKISVLEAKIDRLLEGYRFPDK